MTSRLERRAFLKAALSCIGSLPVLASIGCGSEGAEGVAPSRFRTKGSREDLVLEGYFEDAEIEAAVFIGSRYLAIVAPNASEAEIAALIAPTVDLVLSAESEEAALEALRAKILTDFAEGAIALVDGWLFSVTELQLCVLLRTMLL